MADSGTTLTQYDVQVLLDNPSDDVRAQIAEKVAHGMEDSTLSEEERVLAHGILRTMVNDAAERVRLSLAQSLKYASDVPHDIAMTLARDVDLIAIPMIENSPVFTDEDLMEVIASGNGQKQIAIAGRSQVSSIVAGALVEADNAEVAVTLAANAGAQMDASTIEAMIDRHGAVNGLADSLAQRVDLDITIAERLTTLVSHSLQEVLQKQYSLSQAQAENLSTASRERATVDLVEQAAHTDDVLALVHQLKASNRLTPSLILRSLMTGDIRFFEASISILTGISAQKARILIHDAGTLGFEALFRRSGLPENYFPAFRVAIDVYTENDYDGGEGDRQRFRDRMIERILTQYQDMDGSDMDYLIQVLGADQESKAA